VTVLILVGVLGVVAVAVEQRIRHTTALQKSEALRFQTAVLRRHLGERIDCERTMSVPQCRNGSGPKASSCSKGSVALLAGDGSQLVPAGGGTVGTSQGVRACCVSVKSVSGWRIEMIPRLIIESRAQSPSGQAKIDPLTKKPAAWTSLYDDLSQGPCEERLPDDVVVLRAPARPIAELCPQWLGTSPEYSLPFGADLTCPTGYKVIGANIDCAGMTVMPVYPSFNQTHPGSGALSMNILSDTRVREWCCVVVNAIPLLIYPDRAELVCAAEK
jgi:hypothetical protein